MVCVRPGVELVLASPLRRNSALSRLDLPTLERPTKATWGRPSSKQVSCRVCRVDVLGGLDVLHSGSELTSRVPGDGSSRRPRPVSSKRVVPRGLGADALRETIRESRPSVCDQAEAAESSRAGLARQCGQRIAGAHRSVRHRPSRRDLLGAGSLSLAATASIVPSSASRRTSSIDSTRWNSMHVADLGRDLLEVALVLLREDHLGDAGAGGGEDLVLDAADRQHLAAQRDLAGHGDVALRPGSW